MEGWHIKLSSRVSSRGPVPFYLLVTELFKEANDRIHITPAVASRLKKKKEYKLKSTKNSASIVF
jgi:hypothetical protein